MRLPSWAFHLAEESNWPSIERFGLWPASALIAASGSLASERAALERSQRLTHTVLPSGAHVRDQRPMPAPALAVCLVGLQPSEWYAHINSHVFFWLDAERLNRQRAACEPRGQVVAVVDAAALIAGYAERVFLTPINTGNARRRPARRGLATFVPYKTWLQSAWQSEAAGLDTKARDRRHLPVELAIRGAIPDFRRFVQALHKLPSGTRFSPHAA